MAAYCIFDIDVTDPEGNAEYRKLAGPTVEAYGGRYIVRGGATETLEGDWRPNRVVVLEFESVEQARAWYNSPEYEGPKALRQKTANCEAILVEGVSS